MGDEVMKDEEEVQVNETEEKDMGMKAEEEKIPMAPTPDDMLRGYSLEEKVDAVLAVVKYLVSNKGPDAEKDMKSMFPILR